MATIVIGIDIGQQHDPTALAVVEVEERPAEGNRKVEHYTARLLQRLPLGTPYPQITTRLAEVVRGARHQAIKRERDRRFEETGQERMDRPGPSVQITTYLDATGVGKPIVDMMEEAGVNVIAVYFTHGDRRTEEQGRVTLGKAFMVSRLQALLQSSRLHLPPDSSEAKVLAKELLDYEIKIDQNANDTYGAFRVGTHDDLVTAVGLAVQRETPAGTIVSNYLTGAVRDRYAGRRVNRLGGRDF